MRSILQSLSIVALLFAAVYFLADLYDRALRDSLFFDGWILVAGFAAQFLLHVKKRRPAALRGSELDWQRFHIGCGFFVILIFALHTRLSWPDTAFEWSIWSLFVVVAVSGVVGSILNRAIPSRLKRIGERLEAGQLAGATADLSDQAFRVAMDSVRGCGTLALSDLYATTLMGHFRGPKNGLAHLKNSRRPLQRLLFEIDSLRPQFERGGHDALDRMKQLVEEKDRIDFQCVHERVLVAWLSVHLPATYALILLSMLHVLSVYAFRSGVAEMLALTPQALP